LTIKVHIENMKLFYDMYNFLQQSLYNSAVMLQEGGDPKGWALATKR